MNFTQAKIQLSNKLKTFFSHDLLNLKTPEKILRLEVLIKPLNLLPWLEQQTSQIKTYWSDREQKFEMAGVGEAEVISGQQAIDFALCFNQLKQSLSPVYKNLRYYGGISFNRQAIRDPSWQTFGNYRFLVPRFELYRENQEYSLVCNFKLDPSQDAQNQLKQLLHQLDELNFKPSDKSPKLPSIISRRNLPNERGWYQNIETALAAFERGESAKIVLARQAIFECLEPLEPLALLEALKQTNRQLFHFCFQVGSGKAFIGASPERLYYRLERLLQTEAIAGTRRRGQYRLEDEQLATELLNSDKDNREHEFVVHSLQSALYQMCHTVGLKRKPTLLKLNKIQHLYTPCNGILSEEISDADILGKLHPTPAVGGYPKAEAIAAIEKIEPFERGWYASPVGWIANDSAEFVVGIRSGLVENNQLSLYSGAGIVQGSNPQEEWLEIENKIGSFLQLMEYASSETAAIAIE